MTFPVVIHHNPDCGTSRNVLGIIRAAGYVPTMIEYLVEGCGAGRVLYGSDQPMRDPRQQLGWVIYSKLSLADKKKVLGLNAKKLLDRIRAGRKRDSPPQQGNPAVA